MKTLLARAVLGVVLTVWALFALAAPAQAAAGAPAVAFTLDPATVVHILVAFVLPALVGLVTTRVTKPAVKAWTLAGLSLLTSLLIEAGRALTAAATYDLGVALLAALPAFVVSVASYHGLLKPTGITARAQDMLITAPGQKED